MKRIITLFCIIFFVMVLTFAGCGNTSAVNSTDATESSSGIENNEAGLNDETENKIIYASMEADQELFDQKIDYSGNPGEITKMLSNVNKDNAFYYQKGEFVSSGEFSQIIRNALPHDIMVP